MTNEQQQWVKDTGRWSYHLGNRPDWVNSENEEMALGWYNNPDADPNAEVQRYLEGQRSQGRTDTGDREALSGYGYSGGTPGSYETTGNDNPFAPPSSSPYSPPSSNSSSISSSYQSGMPAYTPIPQDPKRTELYNMLMGRAQQGLAIDPNDPIIRNQVEAYSGEEERAARNYLSDVAEAEGPYANVSGERRMASERVGQRVGSMEAQLIGRELQSRREEISQALAQMGDMLDENQRYELQRELQMLDMAIREKLGAGQLELGWGELGLGRDRLGIDQGRLDLDYDRLGLEAEDRASYWDWLRRTGGRG